MKKNRIYGLMETIGLFKMIKIMRFTIFILFLSLSQTFAMNSYSQQTKLSLDMRSARVEDVIDKIEKISEFFFMYNKSMIDVDRKVDIQVEERSVNEVLDKLFSNTGITYSIKDRQILLINNRMADSGSASIAQQQKSIFGKVTDDSSGASLPGVSVVIKGTTTGTITDMDGNYTLSNVSSNATIIFSFVGMKPLEIKVEGKSNIDVVLVEETIGLDEVVAIGYGTQKRTTITGAVSVVKGDEISKTPVANISNSIAGKLAGVSMRPNGGQPGQDSPDIHIRGIATTGSNAPLIVVDGVVRDNMNQIDQSTIASISVLKDAAAVAPYGLGGANGVILITTKKGDTGAPTLTFNTYYGIQKPTYYPKLLNAVDYMKLSNEAYLNANPGLTTIPYSTDVIANYPTLHAQDPDRYPDSNTKDLVKLSVPVQNFNVQLSGGTEKVKYFGGLGYFKQDGMFDPLNYHRYNYSMNVESKVTNTTTVSLSLLGSIEQTNDLDDPNASNPATTSSNNSISFMLWRSGFKYVPIQPIYYANGLWGQFAGNSPVGALKSGSYNRNDGTTSLGTFSLEQQLPFIKGLSVKGTFSYDTRYNFIKGWHQPYYYYIKNADGTYAKDISALEGQTVAYTYLRQEQQQRKTLTYQGYINYSRSFGKSDITGLFVAEARSNSYAQLVARRNNYAIAIDELSMGSSSKTDFDNAGSSTKGTQIGYVYRLGYVYDKKYMLEASGRYDGHYYFAPSKKWAYFPAFSVGWRLSEENFMKNLTFVNNLKIRGSWGKSGNLAGSAYQYLSAYTLQGNGYAYGTGTMVQNAFQSIESNPNITWEISTKTDVGFDATLWNSLLTLEADYFYEDRTGMLLAPSVKVPLEYGLTLAQQNAGEMTSHGIELTAGSRYDLKNGLKLGLSANFSIAKNKMVQVYETAATYNNPNRRITGRALNTPFGYHALGLFSTSDDKNGDGIINATDGYNVTQFGILHPGDIKYQDISGANGNMVPDGKIEGDDQIAIGYPTYPLMSFGFTPTAEWKGFDLSLFFQGSSLSSINIQTFQTVPFNSNNSNADYEYLNNRWTPQTQNGKYPRATPGPYANNTQASDFWMSNTTFLRLKTATLGYSLPKSVLQFLNIHNLRVYFSGQNMLTFSGLKFMDPEVGYTNRDVAYPNMKSFTFGANVTF